MPVITISCLIVKLSPALLTFQVNSTDVGVVAIAGAPRDVPILGLDV